MYEYKTPYNFQETNMILKIEQKNKEEENGKIEMAGDFSIIVNLDKLEIT